jgi:hypothetical protein
VEASDTGFDPVDALTEVRCGPSAPTALPKDIDLRIDVILAEAESEEKKVDSGIVRLK